MSESSITAPPPFDFSSQDPGAGSPVTPGGRALLGIWSLLLVAGFTLASSLEPDPRGYGTHQGLGLPPCSFQILFDINCPSCGSTTCFAYFVRGHWIAAAQSNIAAFCLALVCLAMIPWSWYAVWRGRLWKIQQPAQVCVWVLATLCSLSLVQWIVRM